jgi:hypothetical protein
MARITSLTRRPACAGPLASFLPKKIINHCGDEVLKAHDLG